MPASAPTDDPAPASGAGRARGGILGRALGGARAEDEGPARDDALLDAVRAATLLGWLSVGAVLVGLAAGLPVRDAQVVLGLTLLGGAGHAVLASLPWARLLATPRGRLLLDAWSAALLAATAGLVLTAGGASRLDLLFFLVGPFLAITHDGPRLAAWLVAATAVFVTTAIAAPDPAPPAETVVRLLLLGGAIVLGLRLARAVRREAVARDEAITRAELEGAMLAEAHHRTKNSLQVVADLLLLGRPESTRDGAAFDQASGRIRAIAAVHDVLAVRGGGRAPADALLRSVADVSGSGHAEVDAAPLELTAERAQRLGLVAGELVANASEHGRPPIHVRFAGDAPGSDGRPSHARLVVRDAGGGPTPEQWAAPGLGLQLAHEVAEKGLGGSIEMVDGAVVVRLPLQAPARSSAPRPTTEVRGAHPRR